MVVATGGMLGMGERLRLIEHEQLRPADGRDQIRAGVDQAAFENLPVVTHEDIDRGRIQLSATGRGNTAQASQANETPTGSASTEAQYGMRHARASELEGKELRANGQEVGGIDEVVIDLQQGRALALVEVEDSFAGTEGKYLVPLAKLQFGSTDAYAVSTSLSRSDFSADARTSSQSGHTNVTTAPTGNGSSNPANRDSYSAAARPAPRATSTNPEQENPTPTGRSSAEFANRAEGYLSQISTRVQEKLKAAGDLADVDVSTKDGKIVLSGSVDRKETKSRAEQLAEQVASSAQIDNKVDVNDK